MAVVYFIAYVLCVYLYVIWLLLLYYAGFYSQYCFIFLSCPSVATLFVDFSSNLPCYRQTLHRVFCDK